MVASSIPPWRKEVVMLEMYFVEPATVDRIRCSWIGAEIENYLVWLVEHGYSSRSIWRRVPIVFAFGEFARARGAGAIGELPAHVDAFVASRVARHEARTGSTRPTAARPALRRCPAGLLRLPGRRARTSPRLGAWLSPSPRPLRGLPAADRRRVDLGALAGDPQRLRRRAGRRGAGQEHGPRWCWCPARVPALRAP